MYIHSKRRKLGTFILFQKCQFAYPFKQSKFATNSQISFIFNLIKREGARKRTFGENSFYSGSPSEKYC